MDKEKLEQEKRGGGERERKRDQGRTESHDDVKMTLQ